MMNKSIRYIPWYPFEETKEYFDIIDYIDTFDSLIINLKKRDNLKSTYLHITFIFSSKICRVMNETYRSKINTHGREYFHDGASGPLYIVENSDYMESLAEESLTLTNMLHFKHYFITDSEWTFDVAAQRPPKVDLFIEGELVKQA